jgi:AraC-like DNA-binding protein
VDVVKTRSKSINLSPNQQILQFSFDLYSSILLIFFTHSIVYTCLLFVKYYRQKRIADFWLGCFLFLGALYILPYMVGFAGWYNTQPYRDILFYTPFQHLLITGPVIYFYVQSLLNPGFRFTRKHWVHFLPAILYLIYCLFIFMYDKSIVHGYYFLEDQTDRDFDTWYQTIGFVSMLVYFALSIRYYHLYRKLIFNVSSTASDSTFNWVRDILTAFFSLLLAWSIITIVSNIKALTYINEWWYYLAVALAYYYIAISGFSNAIITKYAFRPPLISSQKQVYLLDTTLNPIGNYEDAVFEEVLLEEKSGREQETDQALMADWGEKIAIFMAEQHVYRHSELSLPELAKKLNTNVSLLSKIINRVFKMNFNDFVNKYRVMAVISLIKEDEHKTKTLLGIAFECGFNSKTTFNRAFKKHTGLSPQTWIAQNR